MAGLLRSDDGDGTSPGGGDEGAGFPEGDLGQASLASCCLKPDTPAPLLPSTWIAYLMHTPATHDANALPVSPLLLRAVMQTVKRCLETGIKGCHLLVTAAGPFRPDDKGWGANGAVAAGVGRFHLCLSRTQIVSSLPLTFC